MPESALYVYVAWSLANLPPVASANHQCINTCYDPRSFAHVNADFMRIVYNAGIALMAQPSPLLAAQMRKPLQYSNTPREVACASVQGKVGRLHTGTRLSSPRSLMLRVRTLQHHELFWPMMNLDLYCTAMIADTSTIVTSNK